VARATEISPPLVAGAVSAAMAATRVAALVLEVRAVEVGGAAEAVAVAGPLLGPRPGPGAAAPVGMVGTAVPDRSLRATSGSRGSLALAVRPVAPAVSIRGAEAVAVASAVETEVPGLQGLAAPGVVEAMD
jgi:hypothetical protein